MINIFNFESINLRSLFGSNVRVDEVIAEIQWKPVFTKRLFDVQIAKIAVSIGKMTIIRKGRKRCMVCGRFDAIHDAKVHSHVSIYDAVGTTDRKGLVDKLEINITNTVRHPVRDFKMGDWKVCRYEFDHRTPKLSIGRVMMEFEDGTEIVAGDIKFWPTDQ